MASPPSIRTAVAEDLPFLRDIYRRSSLSNDGDRPALLAHPDALVFTGDAIEFGWTRVALVGRLVGFATARPDGPHLELDDLFVDPDQMRQGVARALIADARTIARSVGMARIEVTANDHAMKFYVEVGFVSDGMAETEFGPAIRMHLDVSVGDSPLS